MDTFDAIYSRRAVKHYDPEHELSDDQVQKLLEAHRHLRQFASEDITTWKKEMADLTGIQFAGISST